MQGTGVTEVSRACTGVHFLSGDLSKKVRFPLGIDIGGTMTKIIFFRPIETPELPSYVIREPDSLGELPIGRCVALMQRLDQLSGVLRFIKIPSEFVPEFVEFLMHSGLGNKFLGDVREVRITGGGAHKYARMIEERMGVTVVKLDEMGMLVDGLNFFLKNNVYEEVFTYNAATKEKKTFDVGKSFFPYLLVNIGSGVSILRVDDFGRYERVSGTSVGGGTFWGLCRLLTKVKTFSEVEHLCNVGHNASVDLLVSDIYGTGGFESLGLSGEVIASSFGKIGSVRHVNEVSEPGCFTLCFSLIFSLAG
jgi:pantothenate kinase